MKELGVGKLLQSDKSTKLVGCVLLLLVSQA